MELSASRERSLDWRAADAIEALQIRVAELERERAHLRDENRVARNVDIPPEIVSQPDTETPAVRFLSIQEAAELLNVSYSTVFVRRRQLGFFQIGRVWRITLDGLKKATSGEGEQRQEPLTHHDGQSAGITDPRSPSARQAAREFDELLRIRTKRQRDRER
ncbi:helix-turn-helix domain-containing protein [Burkholderia cepacia]|uniref:helix-turn-helix domain-containing protein n=1 Tax=Burkholderia cepacia TaxID=292 RepID=UPI001CF16AAF|nr:helix-turn-helix domain-containing protein [Burkholderia cepacia]MCA8080862.1 helix-turn-helix domain-containing protein [Burkholderia cepacia]